MLSSTPSLGGSRSSPNARQAKNLSSSASLPQLTGSRPSLPDKIHAMAEGLHTQELKSRQRLFASHAHDPQLLQQLVQQNAQMLQFMMQQNQNQAAPQQNPGVPPGAQHGQNTASMKPVPPEEFTGTCYEAWKKRIEEWVVLFSNLDAAQKAPLLKRFLKGDVPLARRTLSAVPTARGTS